MVPKEANQPWILTRPLLAFYRCALQRECHRLPHSSRLRRGGVTSMKEKIAPAHLTFMILLDLCEWVEATALFTEPGAGVVNQPHAQTPNQAETPDKGSSTDPQICFVHTDRNFLTVIWPVRPVMDAPLCFLLFCLFFIVGRELTVIYCDRQPMCWSLVNEMTLLKCWMVGDLPSVSLTASQAAIQQKGLPALVHRGILQNSRGRQNAPWNERE